MAGIRKAVPVLIAATAFVLSVAFSASPACIVTDVGVAGFFAVAGRRKRRPEKTSVAKPEIPDATEGSP